MPGASASAFNIGKARFSWRWYVTRGSTPLRTKVAIVNGATHFTSTSLARGNRAGLALFCFAAEPPPPEQPPQNFWNLNARGHMNLVLILALGVGFQHCEWALASLVVLFAPARRAVPVDVAPGRLNPAHKHFIRANLNFGSHWARLGMFCDGTSAAFTAASKLLKTKC